MANVFDAPNGDATADLYGLGESAIFYALPPCAFADRINWGVSLFPVANDMG